MTGIEAVGLTKRYGAKTVVDGLTFTVRPGTVTGFLGPNGAGKSTTMRMLLSLDAPTHSHSTVGGRVYAAHTAPLHEVGALLEARSVHPGRTAHNHLMALAHTHGIPRSRVTRVLDIAGLSEPVNGLDLEGVLWIRNLLKSLAAEGRTVLISSYSSKARTT